MKLCPIAIAVGCKKCPLFKICPLKGVIGDMPAAPAPAPQVQPKAKTKARTKSAAKPRAVVSRKKKS